jgi:hypothetical protein
MNAVTTALACGEITPGEAATVARGNLLQILTADDDIEDEDTGDAEAIDGCNP